MIQPDTHADDGEAIGPSPHTETPAEPNPKPDDGGEMKRARSQRGRNGIAVRPPLERLHARLKITEDGCHEWTGALDYKGYARLAMGGQRNALAHRVAYESAKGAIPAGLVLDHLCRNRRCCNPDHLEPVTSGENSRRGAEVLGKNRKTHCVNGHEYTPANSIIERSGSRRCRICRELSIARRPR